MGTRPPLCNCVSLGLFLIKLKDTNVYMFFLCVIYPRFVLIKKKKIIEMIHFWIYIYIFLVVENILVSVCLDVTLKMRKENFLVCSTIVMVC